MSAGHRPARPFAREDPKPTTHYSLYFAARPVSWKKRPGPNWIEGLARQFCSYALRPPTVSQVTSDLAEKRSPAAWLHRSLGFNLGVYQKRGEKEEAIWRGLQRCELSVSFNIHFMIQFFRADSHLRAGIDKRRPTGHGKPAPAASGLCRDAGVDRRPRVRRSGQRQA